jgi:hypothetical protein
MGSPVITYHNCGNIVIDGDFFVKGALGLSILPSAASRMARTNWETAVLHQLKRVSNTWTGWSLLKAIWATDPFASQKKIRIVPFTVADKALVPPGSSAYADADNWAAAAPVGGVPIYRGESNKGHTPEDERLELARYKGTAKGSSSTVHYNAEDGLDSESVLVHELVHALREMRGVFNRVPTEPFLDKYENEEEFFAVVVQMTYQSEKGSRNLSFSHIDNAPTPESWNTSEGWLSDPLFGPPACRLIEKLNRTCSELCDYLKNAMPAHVQFNPIPEYLKNRVKYWRGSDSRFERDGRGAGANVAPPPP